MLKYLRKKPSKIFERSLFDATAIDRQQIGLDLAPVIDGDFFPKPIDELRLESPKKNHMAGTCQYEALLFSKPFPFKIHLNF